jgi:alpha/beta hydrolase family protein DUF900
MSEPFHSALEKSGIDVIDLTDSRGSNALNHSKFADSPQVVQLIGQKLIDGQTIQGSGVSFGERVGGFVMGVRSPFSSPTRGEPMTNRSSILAMSSTRPPNRRQVNSTTQRPANMAAPRTTPIARSDRAAAGHCRSRASIRCQLGAECVARAEGGLPRFYNISFGYAPQAVPPKPQAGG